MEINQISVSRKKCYDLCQQQYKFRYHEKIERPGPEPFYFVYGTIVHRVAEVYVQEKAARPITSVAEDIFNGIIPLDDQGTVCPALQEDYIKKFPKHLKAIENLTKKVGTDGYTEHEFRFDLDAPHGRFVTGFIDRLIIRGEGDQRKAFIIDYKTTKKGKYRINNQTVLEDLQLRCYSRVVQKEFGIPAANIKAALFYLEGENIVAATYNDQSLLKVENELKDGFIKIQQSDPLKVWGNVGWHCKTCDYNTMCPFYKPQDAAVAKWSGDLDELGHENSWG